MIPPQVSARIPKRMPHSLGFARYALSFDGVDDYVEIPYNASLDITKEITISAMVRPRSVANNPDIFSYNDWNRTRIRIRVDNQLQFFVVDSAGTMRSFLGGNVPLDSYSWVTGIANTTTKRGLLIVNGSVVVNVAIDITDLGTWSDARVIGCYSPNFGHFEGSIALLLVYDRALSPEEDRRNMMEYHNPIRSGLKLWIPFEEGTGLVTHDKSGNGNHGTLKPAADPPIWTRVRQYELRAETGL